MAEEEEMLNKESLGKMKAIIDEPGSGVYVLTGDIEYIPERKIYRIIADNGGYLVNEGIVLIIKPLSW